MKNYYTFCYRDVTIEGSATMGKITVALNSVRSLARHLNRFKTINPNFRVLVAFISDGEGKFKSAVKFLSVEYEAQRWLGGYKERLLACAVDQGYELNWNHGLRHE